MPKPPRPTGYSPADVTLSNLICQPDGTGMATLSAVITVLRTDAEIIENLEVIVNGFASAGIPTERPGSPTTPTAGQKLHTYDWSDMASCGQKYSVQAKATIVVRTNASSVIVEYTCQEC